MRPRLPRGPSPLPTPELPSLFSRRASPATFARRPMLRPSKRTAPRPPPHFAYGFVLLESIPAAEAARSAARKFRCWKPRAETVRGPLLPNHTLSARPLLLVAALLLRQTPLHLPPYIALLAIQVPLAPSA